MDTWPYEMKYQVVAGNDLVGWKSFYVESSWWVHTHMETEKHTISIVGTTAFGGFTVWGCFSLNCKLDLYVLDGTSTGQKYHDQILRPLVVPHFDCHPLASRPILMNDNARPHRAKRVQDYLQQDAIELYLGQPCHRIWIRQNIYGTI
jgi:hypothetical protein